MKATVMSVLLCLLSALVEVHSQTVPYVSFMGTNLTNHSYVDLNLVGSVSSEGVLCHTDLSTCCSSTEGVNRGDWFFPNGSKLPTPSPGNFSIFQSREAQRISLRYRGTGPVSGIYCCTIDTVGASGRETVYAGLYAGGGDVEVYFTITEVADTIGGHPYPQLKLICVSIGGPATTVTWTRDSQTVSGGMTVLENPVAARYSHTLTVTERLRGQYQCTISNNKPSQDSASFTVQEASAPTDLMAVQEGPAGIRVSWTPPTPLGDTTGYRVYYSGGSSGSVDVSGGSTDNLLLTGLQNGACYIISIMGTSEDFSSDRVYYPNSITLSDTAANSCDNASKNSDCSAAVGGGVVGGFVGGVLMTAVVAAVIFVVFAQRMRSVHMKTDMLSGVAMTTQESTYETLLT